MDNKNTVTDLLEETAACEALGANTTAESTAYQTTLADDQTGATTRLDRDLRETTARLAAASPHMTPPANLRGRILEATAPKTFKMEDYRKATKEDPRFYKWGFYAAAAFLIMASLYNLSVRRDLDNNTAQFNQKLAALQNQNNQLAAVGNEMKGTLATMVDPHTLHLTWKDENGKPYARAIVNPGSGKAVLIMPEEMVANGVRPQLTMAINNQTLTFDTALITAPAVQIAMTLPSKKLDFKQKPAVEKLVPDEVNKVDVAGVSPLPQK
jgi:hypothetical protein